MSKSLEVLYKILISPPHKGEGIPTTGPGYKDWDRFWGNEATQKFTRISWSKRRILQVLKPYCARGKKALDAGCGSGFFSKYFCDEGMEAVSLDYSKSALEIAFRSTTGRTRIMEKDLLNEGIPRDIPIRFDLIFSDGLLEHFSSGDQDRIVLNLKALLTPQGVLVTFVPNRFSPWELIRPWFMPGIEETPFVLKELVHLNQRNGLKVLARGGVNTFPFVFSPDRLLGSAFGMLLYTVAQQHPNKHSAASRNQNLSTKSEARNPK